VEIEKTVARRPGADGRAARGRLEYPMMEEKPCSGDPVPQNCGIIEVRLQQMSQLFDSMDPSPFHEKDLDRNAVEYIVGSAHELPDNAPLASVVYLDKPAGHPDEGRIVGDAIREHFARQSVLSRRELRQLLRRGWVSLAIGLVFLAAALTGSASVTRLITEGALATVFRESLLIGGWVAMWRPLETFLYEWWPLLGERRVYDRLSRMAVRIVYMGTPTDRGRYLGIGASLEATGEVLAPGSRRDRVRGAVS
jgi:hypothetical protein